MTRLLFLFVILFSFNANAGNFCSYSAGAPLADTDIFLITESGCATGATKQILGSDIDAFIATQASDRELLFNSGGTLSGDTGLTYQSSGNLNAAQYCDENNANCFDAVNATLISDNPIYSQNISFSSAGNVGVGEDDLISYTIPANTLSSGKGLRFTAWGEGANNGNAKTVRCYFGAQSLFGDGTLLAGSPQDWYVKSNIFFVSSGNHLFRGSLERNTAVLVNVIFADTGYSTEDETGSIVLKCTGEGVSDNDIVQYGSFVEIIN